MDKKCNLPVITLKLMTHEQEKSADNSQFFSHEFCRRIKIGGFHVTHATFLADFLGWGLNMADLDEEIAAAFLGPVAWMNVT